MKDDPAQALYAKKNKSLDFQEVDGFASWAFYLSIAIIGVAFIPPLLIVIAPFPFVSIILACIAIYRTSTNKKKGRGYAIAALIISAIQIAIMAIAISLL